MNLIPVPETKETKKKPLKSEEKDKELFQRKE